MARNYRYVVVGSGLAGASAADGIREVDPEGPVLVLGREHDLPYHRPPLSKALWLGKKTVEEIFLHDREFYQERGIELRPGAEVVGLDPRAKTVADSAGETYSWEKLLLATGGRPRRLQVPGGDLPQVCHYRTLSDYQRIREAASAGSSALVVGGGFIGSEMAAALQANQVKVTMVYGGPYLCDRVFPESLGRALESEYEQRGIAIHAGDVPTAFERQGDGLVAKTKAGREIAADFVIVGIGISPETRLAEMAGLEVDNGVVVDEELRTSNPDIYAAGDNAAFPYLALGARMRVEHWDHAVNQGRRAGRNMAGERARYDHMPYFFSDLFEFGYEAVGEVDSRLRVWADWQEENKRGVLYYLADDVVRGVMLCDVWDKVEEARALIREKKKAEWLAGAIW